MSNSIYNQLLKKGKQARIAVMRYRFIGDTLLTVPFLKALKTGLPDASIDVLVAPNSGEVLSGCPYVDQLVFWDTNRKHRYEIPTDNGQTKVQRPQNFFESIRSLKQGNYDAIFVLKRSFSSALMARLSGIPIRIGFNTESRGFLLTQTVPYLMDRHESECYLDHLRESGFPDACFDPKPELEIWLNEDEKEKARSRFVPFDNATLGIDLKHVVVHLTSSNTAKEWPIEKSRELLNWLLSQEHLHIHFLGASSDHNIYDSLIESMPDDQKIKLHNWCGEFSIRESAAFLGLMDLAVGVDSGTLHMARAVKIPTIVLFGPMSETKWCPQGAIALTHAMACHPCHLKSPCHHEFSCIRELSSQTVINACQTILKV